MDDQPPTGQGAAVAPDFDASPLLTRALAAGGLHADLFVEDSTHTSVAWDEGEVRTMGRRRERGAALRVLGAKGASSLSTTTSLSPKAWSALADDIVPLDGTSLVVPPSAPQRTSGSVLVHPEQVSWEQKVALTRLADKAARVSAKVVQVSVRLSDTVRRRLIATSGGALCWGLDVRVGLLVEVVARDGATESAYESIGATGGYEHLDEATVEKTAQLASARALRLLRAKAAPAGTMPVVIAGEAGGTFVHEAVGHALEADAVWEGLSVFENRIGRRIASPLVNVVDDPTLRGAHGSFDFDDEGVPAQRRVLVENGLLVDYLRDQRTCGLMGGRPGAGRRESFRDRPLVRMSNTLILPGTDDPAAIIKDTPDGLYVVRMGGGEVDTVTGQFVFEAAEAWRIRRGRVEEPVRGATLAGRADRALLAIDRVGNDLGFGVGWCGKEGQDVPVSDGEPTLRISKLVVGGG